MFKRFFATTIIFLTIANYLYAEVYSIEFRKADIKNVLRLLAEIEGFNIIIPENLNQTVTASFKNTTIMNAMVAILRSNGLDYIKEQNIMQIATRDTLEKLGRDLRTKTYTLKYSKANDIVTQVKSLISERGSVVADVRTNSITVKDIDANIYNVEILIDNLDKEDRQVLIESKIIEASVSFITSLGIQWGFTKMGNNLSVSGISGVGSLPSIDSTVGNVPLNVNTPGVGSSGSSPVSGLGFRFGFLDVISDIQLTAAEARGDISVLSRPSVYTLNNHPAKIRSGVTFYVKTAGDVTIGSGEGSTGTTTSSGASNLETIESGIELSVTPQIMVDDFVKLTIEAIESQPDFSRAVDGIPAIIDNTAATTAMLKDGQTTVIGGLYSIRKTRDVRGVPILSRIPVLGALFRSKTDQKTKSELLIFITPSVIKGALAKIPGIEEERLKENPSKKPKES